MSILAEKLKELREEKKLSRKQMAEMLKIHETTYGKYELGIREPDFETIKFLAEYHKVSIDYLLGYTDSPEDYKIKIDADLLEEISVYATKNQRSVTKEIEFAVAKYIFDIKKDDIIAPFTLLPFRHEELKEEYTEEEAREGFKKLKELYERYIMNEKRWQR